MGILELDRRIAVDRYADNKETGSFILIDPESYDTVGMGMVDEVLEDENANRARISAAIVDLIRSTESHARSIAKAASWLVTGSFDTFIIAALITGSPRAAGAVALTEILTKTALFYFHERIWILIPWGKRPGKREKDPHSDSSLDAVRWVSAGIPARLGTRRRNNRLGDLALERQ